MRVMPKISSTERAGLQRLEHREQPVVIHPAQPAPQIGAVSSASRFAVQAVQSHLYAPDRLHQRHFKAGQCMTSPVAFICVPSVRLASANLSKGHFGILTTI